MEVFNSARWYPKLGKALRALFALGAFALLFAWLCVPATFDMDQPVYYGGDGLETVSYFDHDYIANDSHTRLHAPFEQERPQAERRLFNALFQSNSNLIWLAHAVGGGEAVRSLNLAYLATYLLAFAIAYWTCRRLGLGNPYRFCAAALYALMPYHFLRGEQHFFESSYFLTPLLALLVLRLWSARPLSHRWSGSHWRFDWSNRQAGAAILLLVCFSSFHAYHQFFFAVLAACVAPLAALYRRSWRPLAIGWLLALLAVGVLVVKSKLTVALITPELSLAVNGQNISAYGEAEKYPLKLAQLVLPVEGHRWQPFAALRTLYDGANPLNNENSSTSLGLIGSLGLFGCLVVALLPAGRLRMSVAGKMGVVALLVFLFASMGGISSLISTASLVLLGPHAELTQTRGWNRMVIFLGFFAYFTAFWTLRWSLRRLGQRVPKVPTMFIAWPVTAAVFAFALWDQVPYKIAQQFDGHYLSDKKFFGTIEADLPPGSRIFQLPFVIHHLSGWVRPGVYYTDGLRPYIASKQLRFTYGGDRGTTQLQWLRSAAMLPPTEAASYLCAYGFAGVVVQRTMLEDAAALETPWTAVAGAAPRTSDDGVYSFFDLRPYCASHAIAPVDLREVKARLLEEASHGRHFIDGAALEHQVGQPHVDADGRTVEWTSPATETGWLAFGPREPLAPGRYRATFRFSQMQAIGEHGPVAMDIMAQGAANETILSTRQVEPRPDTDPVDSVFTFAATRELADFQYRVYKPQGVDVRLTSVAIERIGD